MFAVFQASKREADHHWQPQQESVQKVRLQLAATKWYLACLGVLMTIVSVILDRYHHQRVRHCFSGDLHEADSSCFCLMACSSVCNRTKQVELKAVPFSASALAAYSFQSFANAAGHDRVLC